MRANPMSVLRSLLFYPAFYLGTAVWVLLAFMVMPFGPRIYRRVVDGWSAYHRLCARVILGIRVVLDGELPSSNVLFALKHESFFEAIDTPNLLDYPVVFAKAQLLRIPFWGRVGGHYGLVPVEREQGAKALRAMVTIARKFASEGRPIAIFPEGTRIPHGETGAIQAGFAGLYKLIGLPVVPIAVDSGPLYHRRWKLPGTITYRVGETIPPGLPRAEIEKRIIAELNVLNGAE